MSETPILLLLLLLGSGAEVMVMPTPPSQEVALTPKKTPIVIHEPDAPEPQPIFIPDPTPEPIAGDPFIEAIETFDKQEYLIEEHGFEQGTGVQPSYIQGELFKEAIDNRPPSQIVQEIHTFEQGSQNIGQLPTETPQQITIAPDMTKSRFFLR